MRTITDITLQKYGSIDFVGRVAYENNISVNQNTPATVIADNDGIGDQTIKDYYRLKSIIPSNNKVIYYDLNITTDNDGVNNGIVFETYKNATIEVSVNKLNPIEVGNLETWNEELDGLNNEINIKCDPLKVRRMSFILFPDTLNITNSNMNLSRFENLTTINVQSGNISSVALPITKKPVKLIVFSGSKLSEIDLSTIKSFDPSIIISLEDNNMLAEGVNNTLISLTKNIYPNTGVMVIDGTNAAPTGDGLTAKTTLQSRGWTVTTN